MIDKLHRIIHILHFFSHIGISNEGDVHKEYGGIVYIMY